MGRMQWLLVVAVGASLGGAAAADEIRVDAAVPAAIAVTPARVLTPAEAEAEWMRVYGHSRPPGVSAFAVPAYKADFQPIRSGGRTNAVRIEFGIAAMTPVIVGEAARADCRVVAATAVLRARSEAVDRLNRDALGAVATDVRARYEKEAAKALTKNRGGLDDRTIEWVVADTFRAARDAVVAEFGKRMTLPEETFAALTCRQSADSLPPASPAASSAPPAWRTDPPPATPEGMRQGQLQDVLMRLQRR